MTIEYEVIPHKGIGPVELGMTKDQARAAMSGQKLDTFRKSSNDLHETDAYHNAGFQVFYDGDLPRVEYIELSRDSGFIARYKGVDVFATKAEDLVSVISRDAAYDEKDPELGHSYVFPLLELSVWRPFLSRLGDEQEGRHFSTIGVGIKGYYSKSS